MIVVFQEPVNTCNKKRGKRKSPADTTRGVETEKVSIVYIYEGFSSEMTYGIFW